MVFSSDAQDLQQLRLDFVLMVLFRGNDYLPALVSLGLLWGALGQTGVGTLRDFGTLCLHGVGGRGGSAWYDYVDDVLSAHPNRDALV